jgi:pilus assembly protein CpaC
MKRLILSFLSFLLLSASPAFANPTPLSLMVDHGVPLSLAKPAASVFIANPDIADVQVLSPTQVMIFGKRTGETSFMATDDRGAVLAERTLVVSQDLSALRDELSSAIPGNEIKAKAVPNGIVLTGSTRDAASVADAYKIAMRYMPSGGDIINRVQVTGSNQIQIRVRFAEVQRNVDNSFGFNWQNLLSSGNLAVGLATGSTIGTGSSIIGTRPSNTSLSLPNDVLGASGKIGKLTLNGVIDALQQDGLLTILAEPTLTAMSGETANFLAGGQFPIPIPQGNGTISVQFQSYGISLAFTPTVLSGDRISLHVRPEVSELTDTGAVVSSNITVPALTTRKAETTVEVASGESFAIAGLMDNSQTQTVNKFPMLGDLPVLGALFRSDHFINGQTELVVIITPYIVKPSKHPLALPTDGFAPPTESERLVGMRYSSGDPDARPVSGEPVGVMGTPMASPVAPVSASPVEDKTPPAPPKAEIPATITNLAPAAPQPVPVPPAHPVVLHAPGDADKHNGGLLVE